MIEAINIIYQIVFLIVVFFIVVFFAIISGIVAIKRIKRKFKR